MQCLYWPDTLSLRAIPARPAQALAGVPGRLHPIAPPCCGAHPRRWRRPAPQQMLPPPAARRRAAATWPPPVKGDHHSVTVTCQHFRDRCPVLMCQQVRHRDIPAAACGSSLTRSRRSDTSEGGSSSNHSSARRVRAVTPRWRSPSPCSCSRTAASSSATADAVFPVARYLPTAGS
jgi:hypothetical protein